MEIYQRHIAIRINHLEKSIKTYPSVSYFTRQYKGRAIKKIKVVSCDRSAITLDMSKPDAGRFISMASKKENCEAVLAALRNEWESAWKAPIPHWDKVFKCPQMHSSLLTRELFEQAKEYQNTAFPLNNALMYNNRPYRTKGEIKIARLLDKLGLEYKYEPKLIINGTVCYPDFLVYERETDTVIIIEYGGMLEKREYYDKLAYRRLRYQTAGIREGSDIVYVNEYADRSVEDSLIIDMILSALEQDVVVDGVLEDDKTYIELAPSSALLL